MSDESANGGAEILSEIQDRTANLTFPQMKELLSFVEKDIARREATARDELAQRLHALAVEEGFGSAHDVLGEPGAKKKRPAAPPKYRNPDNASQTWTGRGRKPKWVEAALADGKSLDDLAIKDAA